MRWAVRERDTQVSTDVLFSHTSPGVANWSIVLPTAACSRCMATKKSAGGAGGRNTDSGSAWAPQLQPCWKTPDHEKVCFAVIYNGLFPFESLYCEWDIPDANPPLYVKRYPHSVLFIMGNKYTKDSRQSFSSRLGFNMEHTSTLRTYKNFCAETGHGTASYHFYSVIHIHIYLYIQDTHKQRDSYMYMKFTPA